MRVRDATREFANSTIFGTISAHFPAGSFIGREVRVCRICKSDALRSSFKVPYAREETFDASNSSPLGQPSSIMKRQLVNSAIQSGLHFISAHGVMLNSSAVREQQPDLRGGDLTLKQKDSNIETFRGYIPNSIQLSLIFAIYLREMIENDSIKNGFEWVKVKDQPSRTSLGKLGLRSRPFRS
jgi:hypothetical protein